MDAVTLGRQTAALPWTEAARYSLRRIQREQRKQRKLVRREERQARRLEQRAARMERCVLRQQRRETRQALRLERREARRELARKRNEPPLLSHQEEVINAASHGAGALLALWGMVLLLGRSHTALARTASLFYGVSMVLMMLMSCIYHAMPARSRAKRVCRRFDYTSIYLLIGGTFAPILLLYVGGTLGLVLFRVQWGIILAGVSLVLAFGPGRWRGLLFTLYFALGWSGLAFIPSFCRNARPLLWFILTGGLVYTLGMVPFARKRKYDHCVWHLFVLAAAALHWAGIYTQLY